MGFGCKYSKMIFFGRENRQKVNGGARPGRVRGVSGARPGRGGEPGEPGEPRRLQPSLRIGGAAQKVAESLGYLRKNAFLCIRKFVGPLSG